MSLFYNYQRKKLFGAMERVDRFATHMVNKSLHLFPLRAYQRSTYPLLKNSRLIVTYLGTLNFRSLILL